MKTCSCWLSSDEIPTVFINGDAAIPRLELYRMRGVPRKHLFSPNMSVALRVMMVFGLREHFCPRANLQLGICAQSSGRGRGQVFSGFSWLLCWGSMAVQNRQPQATAEQGSHGCVHLRLSIKKKKEKKKKCRKATELCRGD